MAEAKIQFTPAQAAAIQARGGSLLVSAAAGSGKTRVLVERVAGLITDPDHPVDADSLLIMTFTNAAAAKLRADITKRLAAEIRQHPQDVRLRRQQMLGAALLVLAGVMMLIWHRNEWVLCLTIAAVLELYTAFRIPQEMKNEE